MSPAALWARLEASWKQSWGFVPRGSVLPQDASVLVHVGVKTPKWIPKVSKMTQHDLKQASRWSRHFVARRVKNVKMRLDLHFQMNFDLQKFKR